MISSFKNGKSHGNFTLVTKTGDQTTGLYKEGRLRGKITMTKANGKTLVWSME